MSEYYCSLCDYTSDLLKNAERHIIKKNKCGNNPEILIRNIEIICEYCNKKYSSKPNLKIHQKKSCNAKQLILEKEVEQLKEELTKTKIALEFSQKPQTVNITNNNIIINMNGYKNTSFEHISDKQYNRAIGRLLMSVPQMIQDVHFNPKIPENHNIYISNIKNKYAMVYDGKNWEIKDQERVIDDLIRDHEYAMEEWLGGEGEKFPKAMDNFNKYLDVKEKDGALRTMKEEIKLILYNKRDMIKK